MPALILFGRRWLISSDDVPLPAAVYAAFHFVWCCLLVVWFISVHGPRECSGAWQYDVAVGGLLGSFALSFVLEVLMVQHGLRGGPCEPSKRALVAKLIYLDAVSHCSQIAFNGFGTHLVYTAPRPVCPEEGLWDPIDAMLALVWSTWAIIALLIALMTITYNLFPDYNDAASWEKRCNCLALCLCCTRGSYGQYRDMEGRQQRLSSRLGNLFAMMLSHIDMSPSDILLAFSLAMLLQRIQRRRQREQEQREKKRRQQQGQGEGLGDALAAGAAAAAAGGGGGGGAGAAAAAAGPAGGKGLQQVRPRPQQQQQQGSGSKGLGAPTWEAQAAAGSTGGQAAGTWIEMSPHSSPNAAGSAQSVTSMDDLLGGRGGADLEAGLVSRNSSGLGSGNMSRFGRALSQRPLLSRKQGSSFEGGGGSGRRDGGTGEAAAAAVAAAAGAAGDGKAGWSQGNNLESIGRLSSFVPAHTPTGDGELGEGDGNLQLGAEKTEAGMGGEPQPPEEEEFQPVDARTLQEAAWVCKYAFASYGYLLFIFSQPATGCLQLCFGRNCGLLLGTAKGRRERRKLDLRLVHNLNREATQQAAGLSDHDLLDVRYEGEVPHVLPYFIAVDEHKKVVIVAIRGSLSLDDVVRDLLFEPASLDEWIKPGRRWEEPPPEMEPATASTQYAAHAGILEAARATFIDIQEHGVLHDTLLAPGARCEGYRLIVTGHSLGAGCAFLLALYLRHFCPQLRCWSFSPPGGLASADLCAATSDWCTSVVCGKEWIPRLSLRTFSRMRDEMVYAALRCRRPKWLVLLGIVRGKQWEEDELFYRPEQLPAEARSMLRFYRESVQRNEAVQQFMELAGDFTPPGRCFHLRPTGKVSGGGGWGWRPRPKQRQYRAVYVAGEEVIDQGILLSGRMMADHMPDYLLATLRSMTRSARHMRSTATISDRAGEHLTDQIFEHETGGQDGSTGGGGGHDSSRFGSSADMAGGGGSEGDGGAGDVETGNGGEEEDGGEEGEEGEGPSRGSPAPLLPPPRPPQQQSLPARRPLPGAQ